MAPEYLIPARFPGSGIVNLLLLFLLAGSGSAEETSGTAALAREARLEVIETRDDPELDPALARLELLLTARELDGEIVPLVARLVLRQADGEAVDGSGRGLYHDGRFFAEGRTVVLARAGRLTLEISAGPHHRSLRETLELEGGRVVRARFVLPRWIDLRSRGWLSGDNHVHAQHDARAHVRTDLEYMTLQARANGLDFVTEAGSTGSYEKLDSLNRPDFILRRADEQRPGCFVGHLNTPGIRQPLDREFLEKLATTMLPALALTREVHRLGGVTHHTHPLTPPHLVHWMGATELLAHCVLGESADLLDLDSRASELLWFHALNCGLRLAASGYTDCALGRKRTLSPGDRRVIVQVEPDPSGSPPRYGDIIEGLRQGRTLATSGGSIFPFLRVEGRMPGEVEALDARPGATLEIEVELESLHEPERVELIFRGRVIHRFDDFPGPGPWKLEHRFSVPDDSGGPAWLVARARDREGDWAITSPVYLRAIPEAERAGGLAHVLQISNATRFIELRRQFFAHLLVTSGEANGLSRVSLMREGLEVRRFEVAEGSRHEANRLPVTTLRGDYSSGWAWGDAGGKNRHFQADWPVEDSGWYWIETETTTGEVQVGDALHFDARHPASRALSAAGVVRGSNQLRWWGQGEEMPLEEIRQPFEGDHWWFPRRAAFLMEAHLDGEIRRVRGGGGPLPVLEAGERLPVSPSSVIDLLDRPLEETFYPVLAGRPFEDPRRVFRLREGQLEVSGEVNGYLATRQVFRDYRLIAEFRWGDRNWGERVGKARDSGIFLHAQGPEGNSVDGDGAFRSAIECNVMEGATGDVLLIRGHDARGELLPLEVTAPVAARPDSEGWPTFDPAGKPRTLVTWGRLNHRGKSPRWQDEFGGSPPAPRQHRVEITCRGRTIRIELDGRVVNELSRVQPASGQVLIQSEGSRLTFTRIELHPLDPAPPSR